MRDIWCNGTEAGGTDCGSAPVEIQCQKGGHGVRMGIL